MKIILGSKSAGRREVLENAGYKFEILVPDIDEKSIRTEDYELLPLLIARAKTKKLLPKIKGEAILITSDQVVVCDDKLREKPMDANQAREWLRSYAMHPSKTITSVVVTNTKSGKQAEGVDIVYIVYKKIPESIIEKLILKDRILQAAGASVAEDPLLNPYIEKLNGDIDSVTGLPMKLTEKLIKEVEV